MNTIETLEASLNRLEATEKLEKKILGKSGALLFKEFLRRYAVIYE